MSHVDYALDIYTGVLHLQNPKTYNRHYWYLDSCLAIDIYLMDHKVFKAHDLAMRNTIVHKMKHR